MFAGVAPPPGQRLWYFSVMVLTCIARIQAGVVVTKPGVSEDDCRKACRDTGEIDCWYFKFSKTKSMCYLSKEPNPALQGMVKISKPAGAPKKKPASSWVSQLQARILALEQKDVDAKQLHKEIHALKTELASLKNSRALTHHLLRTNKEEQSQNVAALDDKVETLKAEARRVEDAVMTLGELQKTLGTRIKKLGDTQAAGGLTIAMLSQANKDTRSSVRELATSSSSARTSLGDLRKKITELEVRFAGLSTDVMEKVANVDAMVGPELNEVKGAQTNLAQSLSLLTKKMMVLSPKLPFIQRKLAMSVGRLEGMERSLKDFHKDVNLISNRLGVSEEQLKKFVDPASTINSERRKLITKLRAEVAVLQDGQERIKNDVVAEMADRSHLYKQIAKLDVSRKILVEKVANLEDAVQDFSRDLRRLAVDSPRATVVNHILTRQESALKSLKALRQAQLDIQDVLQRHRQSIGNHASAITTSDQQMMEDEAALREMQGKLLTLYGRLRTVQDKMVHPEVVFAVAQKQKEAIASLGTIMHLQDAIQSDMDGFSQRIQLAERRLEAESTSVSRVGAELGDLRQRTNVLYAAVKWKVVANEDSHHSETLHRLQQLSHRQAGVAHTLDHYHDSLQHTKAELAAARGDGVAALARSRALRYRIKALHDNLERVHEDTNHKHRHAYANNIQMRRMMGQMANSMGQYRHALSDTNSRFGPLAAAGRQTAAQTAALHGRISNLKAMIAQLDADAKVKSFEIGSLSADHQRGVHEAKAAVRVVAGSMENYDKELASLQAELSKVQGDKVAEAASKERGRAELQGQVGQLDRKIGALARAQKAQKHSGGDEEDGRRISISVAPGQPRGPGVVSYEGDHQILKERIKQMRDEGRLEDND